jgi:hypothetical protein
MLAAAELESIASMEFRARTLAGGEFGEHVPRQRRWLQLASTRYRSFRAHHLRTADEACWSSPLAPVAPFRRGGCFDAVRLAVQALPRRLSLAERLPPARQEESGKSQFPTRSPVDHRGGGAGFHGRGRPVNRALAPRRLFAARLSSWRRFEPVLNPFARKSCAKVAKVLQAPDFRSLLEREPGARSPWQCSDTGKERFFGVINRPRRCALHARALSVFSRGVAYRQPAPNSEQRAPAVWRRPCTPPGREPQEP